MLVVAWLTSCECDVLLCEADATLKHYNGKFCVASGDFGIFLIVVGCGFASTSVEHAIVWKGAVLGHCLSLCFLDLRISVVESGQTIKLLWLQPIGAVHQLPGDSDSRFAG